MESNIKEQTRHTFQNVIDSTIEALNTVWEKIGFEDHVKKTRFDTAVQHVSNLMEQMLAEEKTMMTKLTKNTEVYKVKLDKLCEELSINYIKVPDNLSMLKAENMLRNKVEALKTQKNERMEKYNVLHAKDDKLCEILAEIPYYVPSGSVPTLQQMTELEAHVNRMQAEKIKRSAEFNDLKGKICGLFNEMETEPNTTFAHDVVCEDAETFTLSTTKMNDLRLLHGQLIQKNKQMTHEVEDLWDRLKALWNRLETSEIEREAFSLDKNGHGEKVISVISAEIAACEELKLQNIQKFVQGIRKELILWWDKCFYAPDQRKSFTLYYEENFTEDLLEAHEKELERVRDYYNKHRVILDRIEKRDEMFKSMVLFESKASDPKRFFNDRGGKLLQEEKARKRILKDLPKVEEELNELITEWENANQSEFYVNGLRFPQLVIRQWEDFHRHKEQEKQDRMKARVKQTQEEMYFGSKSALTTPGKRKMGAPTTPMRTPLKARKLNNGPVKTPNTTSRLPPNSRIQHSTMLHSPMYTPKTPLTSSNQKRRSIRLMKKAATERRSSHSKRRRSRDVFSHTTVSSENHTTSTLATTCSYNEFATGLSRPNCRSSVAPTTPLSSGLRR